MQPFCRPTWRWQKPHSAMAREGPPKQPEYYARGRFSSVRGTSVATRSQRGSPAHVEVFIGKIGSAGTDRPPRKSRLISICA